MQAGEIISLKNAVSTKFEIASPALISELFPLIPKWCKYVTLGGIYAADGHLCISSLRKSSTNGDHVYAADPLFISQPKDQLPIITGKSAYLGPFMNHYGHFITEGLSRFWDWETLDSYDHIIMRPFVFNRGQVEVRDYHRFIFSRLGIDEKKIIFQIDPVLIEDVDIFEQMWTINGEVNFKIAKLYDHVSDFDRNEPKKRTYIARAKTDFNRFGDAEFIEDEFARLGFDIIHPETMSMKEQLRCYRNSEILAGISGSGMHNIIFTSPGTASIEIGDSRTPTKPIRMQELANYLSQTEHHFVRYAKGKDGKVLTSEMTDAIRAILQKYSR